jgi:hypothetical protein
MSTRTIGERIDECAYSTAFAILDRVPDIEEPLRRAAVHALSRSVIVLRLAATAVAVAPDNRIPQVNVEGDPRFRALAIDAIDSVAAALQPR